MRCYSKQEDCIATSLHRRILNAKLVSIHIFWIWLNEYVTHSTIIPVNLAGSQLMFSQFFLKISTPETIHILYFETYRRFPTFEFLAIQLLRNAQRDTRNNCCMITWNNLRSTTIAIQNGILSIQFATIVGKGFLDTLPLYIEYLTLQQPPRDSRCTWLAGRYIQFCSP